MRAFEAMSEHPDRYLGWLEFGDDAVQRMRFAGSARSLVAEMQEELRARVSSERTEHVRHVRSVHQRIFELPRRSDEQKRGLARSHSVSWRAARTSRRR